MPSTAPGRPSSAILWAVLAIVAAACAGAGDRAEDFDGLWLLASGDVDGEPIPTDRPLFVEIDGQQVVGGTTCNDFGGEFGGEFAKTEKLCVAGDDAGPDPMGMEQAMIAAIEAGPALDGQRLVFTADATRLAYHRVVEPAPADLFPVLDDVAAAVDVGEVFLDPEAGGHPDFARLARLDHPTSDARFYVGERGDLVCFVMTTDDASATMCQPPRFAARGTRVLDLASREGPVGVRAAPIPDAFADAAARRPDLGELGTNVLVVGDDAEAGRHVLSDASGNEFVLDVP